MMMCNNIDSDDDDQMMVLMALKQRESYSIKLEMNCDCSSNNNVGFMRFLTAIFILLGYFYYDRLIGILLMGFLAVILNLNIRLKT